MFSHVSVILFILEGIDISGTRSGRGEGYPREIGIPGGGGGWYLPTPPVLKSRGAHRNTSYWNAVLFQLIWQSLRKKWLIANRKERFLSFNVNMTLRWPGSVLKL